MPLFVWLDPNGDGKPNAVLADRNGYIGGYDLNWYDEFYTSRGPISAFQEPKNMYFGRWFADDIVNGREEYNNRWILFDPGNRDDLNGNPIEPTWVQINRAVAKKDKDGFPYAYVEVSLENSDKKRPEYCVIQNIIQDNYWVEFNPWTAQDIVYNSDGSLQTFNMNQDKYFIYFCYSNRSI